MTRPGKPFTRCILEVTRPDGGKSTLNPKSWPVRLGRAGDNTVCVPEDTTISLHHFSIGLTSEKRLFVQDLGSTNGTKVNGKNIGDLPYNLKDGDTIRAGKTTIDVRLPKPEGPKRDKRVMERLSEVATRFFKGLGRSEKLPPGFVRCPSCGARIHSGRRIPGEKVGCPRCRSTFLPDSD